MLSGAMLLREAARHYDAADAGLSEAGHYAWRNGFSSGAEWMRMAMGHVRGGKPPVGQANFQRLGSLKYAAAVAAGILVLASTRWVHPWCGLLIVPAFYAVEVQWVFLFPVALDGTDSPWRESRALMNRSAGTLAAMLVVLPLAWEMLTGGFRGGGFVRSWCLGCLAVVLWYEHCLHVPSLVETTENLLSLDIGHRAPLLLRWERVRLPIQTRIRFLLVTDLHWTRGRHRALEISVEEAIERHRPQLVILGGDMADTTGGLAALARAAARWTRRVPVLAAPGNHDRHLGLSRVCSVLAGAGVHWLPDGAFFTLHEGQPFLGFSALEAWPTGQVDVPMVAVLHDPAEFPSACHRTAALALAGHLHGCQFVWNCHDGRLLPGAWFYRWNVLRYETATTGLIVSRGCADTLPMRWNCPREIVLCELAPDAA